MIEERRVPGADSFKVCMGPPDSESSADSEVWDPFDCLHFVDLLFVADVESGGI